MGSVNTVSFTLHSDTVARTEKIEKIKTDADGGENCGKFASVRFGSDWFGLVRSSARCRRSKVARLTVAGAGNVLGFYARKTDDNNISSSNGSNSNGSNSNGSDVFVAASPSHLASQSARRERAERALDEFTGNDTTHASVCVCVVVCMGECAAEGVGWSCCCCSH